MATLSKGASGGVNCPVGTSIVFDDFPLAVQGVQDSMNSSYSVEPQDQ